MMDQDPHANQPVLTAGVPFERARAAVMFLHGRGGTAENILALSEELNQTDYAYLAPQAANYEWYPNTFRAPVESNEPWLSSSLDKVRALLEQVENSGIPQKRIILLGFSQGACLALEYVARNARQYGGVVALSGGLIGPDGTPHTYTGSLEKTPVFLGCSDRDPHIPLFRVNEATGVMRSLGAEVTERIYPGMGHTINVDEIEFVMNLMAALRTGQELEGG